MTNYVGVQADDSANDPQNLLAIPVGGGDYSLAVALYFATGVPLAITDLQSVPTSISAHGQQALSTSAAVLPTAAGKLIKLENPITNTINILWGNASAQYNILVPGEKEYIPLSNLNAIYAKSVSGTPSLTYTVFN